MRLQILLLLVIMAAHVVISSPWTTVKFPLKLLQPDLHALSQYYDKVDTIQAFVHWPDSISFGIQMTKQISSNEFHLEINGTFQITKMIIMSTTYEGIYYRHGSFYVKEGKIGAWAWIWKELSPNTKVTYVRPKTFVNPSSAYLSIKYFGLKELEDAVEPFYFDNKNYVDTILRDHPATFLATVLDTMGITHFVEYTFWGENDPNTLADGKLHVLLGSSQKGKLTLTNYTQAYRLVFDQTLHTFTIPQTFNMNSSYLAGVFGVRMATKGFLAEAHENTVLMLNKDDLTFGCPIEKQHSMFVHDLLQKVKNVEPRYVFIKSKPASPVRDRPTRAKFQVHGQVLTKSVNFKRNDYIDHFCPFTIEYANKGRQFLFRGRWVDKIYTDDTKLWVESEGPLPAQKYTVTLTY